ncbi:TonB-dependent receptor plug domain-containing protein [Opitutus sp. ER46]|uniref:TonB-dependent siderophore receptor n=1 Tax=Opitutus sp. ER46 TaxID=2161864 RepID=UPI001304951F|nr:TonB-dependent receptor plug domain-containing protein [Opitutus sp. ER46]
MRLPRIAPGLAARSLRGALATALLGAATFTVRAQSTGAAATPTAAPEAEEVVTLAEFQVVESNQRDAWFASQAMSGSRAAASVLELPYQVQVLTQEFLRDFQLTSLAEQLSFFPAYASSSDQADMVSGSFAGGRTLRGFDQTITRDGFRSTPPPTMANTAQVEVIKGPMSTLYGDASPGGLINYISKRPTVRPRASVSLTAGSYGYFRSEVNASGPLYRDKLFYLVTMEHYYRRGSMDYTYARNADYVASLLYRPTKDTSLTVSYELVRLIGSRGASVPSLVLNPTPTSTRPGLSWSGGVVAGLDWELARARYSRMGPNEHYDRNYDGLNVVLEHAFSRNWKQRVAYQGQWKSFNQNYRTSSNVSSVTRRMNDVRPNRRIQDIDSPKAFQSDLRGQFNTGPIPHVLLITADYARVEQMDRQMRLSNQQVRDLLPDSYRYPNPYDQDWSTVIDYDVLGTVGSKDDEVVTSRGASVSDRVALADGKVLLMANARRDEESFAIDTSTSTTPNFIHGKDAANTYSYGGNWKILDDRLIAFANRSTSFNTNVTIDRNTGTTIPNERGRGWEFGFKSLAFERRLGFTISGFEIEKTNIGQKNPDFVLGETMPEFLGTGRERVRGVDGDVTWKIRDGWTLMAGGAYMDARVVDSTTAALTGTRKTLIPRHTATLATKYKPAGKWKGLSMGASFRYLGSFVRANATSTRLYEEGDARHTYGVFLGYTWQKLRLRPALQVNCNNLFDEFYVGPDNTVGMGRQINVTFSLSPR